jgi:hypothetical protein
MLLGEGHDIVTRGTYVPASQNVNNLGKAAKLHLPFHCLLLLGLCQISAYRLFDMNILGKAAALHLTLATFCSWGCANLSLQNVKYNCAYVLRGGTTLLQQ